MWTLDEIEELNGKRRVAHILSLGAAWPALLCEVAHDIDQYAVPHVACFFQLPYGVALEPTWHAVDSYEQGVKARFRTWLAHINIDARGAISVSSIDGAHPDRPQSSGQFLITQCVAVIPVWGDRLKFFDRYQDCYAEDGFRNHLVVPKQFSWVPGRAMRAADFEKSLCKRMVPELLFILRQVLPAYSVRSLCEAPLPDWLSGLFMMSLPGRLVFNREPETVIRRIVQSTQAFPASPVRSVELKAALQQRVREFTVFEHQLFAMKRICADGESGVATIGTLALAEWIICQHFPEFTTPDWQPPLSKLLKRGELSFLPNDLRRVFDEAILARHTQVHGAPPSRQRLTVRTRGESNRQRQQLALAEDVIRAAFELFRLLNARSSGTANANFAR